MIDRLDMKTCCGCSACVASCPVSALSMNTGKTGFAYPVLRAESCIQCGRCLKTCPVVSTTEERKPASVLAVKNNNISIRKQSSSGGLFTLLAENTIRRGGVVYGAAFISPDYSVSHVRIQKLEDLPKLRGSKYVQSLIGSIHKQVKQDLTQGTEVLFSGTPCQTAGLKSFLRKTYNNLTTIDFVCHGVPDPRIWKEYLHEINRSHESITAINFRDKSDGWRNFRLNISKDSPEGAKVFSRQHQEDPYMQLFLGNYILRPSCHHCHFRGGKSGSDFTMGDFWQIEKFHPDFSDDDGVSLLMNYSNKSLDILNSSSEIREATYEEACYGNRAIYADWPENPARRVFYFFHDYLRFPIKKSFIISRTVLNFHESVIKRAARVICKVMPGKKSAS